MDSALCVRGNLDQTDVKKEGDPISSGLALSCNLAGANPVQVTASHGLGIQPCSQTGVRFHFRDPPDFKEGSEERDEVFC
jgi:hypothetical protein